MKAIKDRRSIRKFKNKEVEKEYLDKIVSSAGLAPSAKNRQPWKFLAYTGILKDGLVNSMKEGLDREKTSPLLPECAPVLNDAYNTLRIMREAPVLIIVLNINAKNPYNNIDSNGRVAEICDSLAIGAAIENMIVTATELNLGSLWIANTFFAYPEIKKFVKTDAQIVSCIAIGYPAESPKARGRKKLDDILEYRN